MLIEITNCDSYLPEVFVNPDKVVEVFTVTRRNGQFNGKVNALHYTVIELCNGSQVKTAMGASTVVAKLNGEE